MRSRTPSSTGGRYCRALVGDRRVAALDAAIDDLESFDDVARLTARL